MSKLTKSNISDVLAAVILFTPLVSAFIIGGKMNGWN